MKKEALRFKANGGKASEADRLGAMEKALEAAKKAKQMLFEKLADRTIDREAFKAKKTEQDEVIADLEQKISDARMAERLVSDTDAEAKERIETARNFLELKDMTEEAWDKFIKDVILYPNYRMEILWNFDEV